MQHSYAFCTSEKINSTHLEGHTVSTQHVLYVNSDQPEAEFTLLCSCYVGYHVSFIFCRKQKLIWRVTGSVHQPSTDVHLVPIFISLLLEKKKGLQYCGCRVFLHAANQTLNWSEQEEPLCPSTAEHKRFYSRHFDMWLQEKHGHN